LLSFNIEEKSPDDDDNVEFDGEHANVDARESFTLNVTFPRYVLRWRTVQDFIEY
jgi:hypothetical protein